MFHKYDNDLQALEQELLAAEPERNARKSRKEPDADETLEEVKQMLAKEDWNAKKRRPLSREYAKDADIDEILYEASDPRPLPGKQAKGEIRPGLIFAMVLETLGLVALVLWWLM